MNIPSASPATPPAPAPRGFWCRLFSWCTARWLLVAVAALVTLLVLILVEENHRGRRAWKKFKLEAEARGEKLDLKSFIPPPVPDERNLAMTQLLRPIHDFVWDAKTKQHRLATQKSRINEITVSAGSGELEKPPGQGSLESGRLADLKAWQDFFRGNTNYPQPPSPQTPALDVLTALGKFDADLKELRAAAAARPECRFDVPYEDDCPFMILLPHLGTLRALGGTLALRATAEVAAGQTDAALADIRLILRLSEGVKREPMLISHLVRIAMLQISLQPLAEGLARHAWSEAQLAEFDKLIGAVDLLAEYEWVMRGERAFNMEGLDWMKRARVRDLNALSAPENDVGTPGWLRLPSGFIDQNKVHIARLHQDYTLRMIDAKARRVLPEVGRAMDAAFHPPSRSPYKILAGLLMPAVAKSAQRTAFMQTLLDELRVACALERHRRAAGNYPDELTALVPRQLAAVPVDLCSGKPLQYRKTGETYLLYSIGWNLRDDGGEVAFKEHGSSRLDLEISDWVWRCPSDWTTRAQPR